MEPTEKTLEVDNTIGKRKTNFYLDIHNCLAFLHFW